MYTSATSLHEQLKLATETIHNALHRQSLLRRLMEPDCILDDYRTVLHVFQRFYLQAEARFPHFQYLRFDGEAPVLNWLTEDIGAVGDADLGPVDPDGETVMSDDIASYVGYLYVKQGATLGGQVLCRALHRSLGLTPERGLRFFSGFGEQTRQNWLYFLLYLDNAKVDPSLAVASAREHFKMLETMLDQVTLMRLDCAAT